jgi:2-polyprenyl-3-methyl-5-hydroxy-6-metoxy-1,4-benzoquinol methylase
MSSSPVHGITGYRYKTAGARGHHAYNVPGIIQALPPGKHRILDAGCGSGFLASELAKQGHDVIGIDISEDGIKMATAAHPGAKFYKRSVFEDLADIAPQGGFDVIVASEVIEHLYSPRAFLVGMFDNVKSGGMVVLTTPYYGYAKNLLIAVTDGWDRHHMVDNEGGGLARR